MHFPRLRARFVGASLLLFAIACHPDREERGSVRAPDPVTQSPALSGPACRENRECGANFTCAVGGAGGGRGTEIEPRSTPPHECDTDAQCPQFRTCRYSYCGPTLCKVDDDCNGGYCVNGQCGARIGRCRSMREYQIP